MSTYQPLNRICIKSITVILLLLASDMVIRLPTSSKLLFATAAPSRVSIALKHHKKVAAFGSNHYSTASNSLSVSTANYAITSSNLNNSLKYHHRITIIGRHSGLSGIPFSTCSLIRSNSILSSLQSPSRLQSDTLVDDERDWYDTQQIGDDDQEDNNNNDDNYNGSDVCDDDGGNDESESLDPVQQLGERLYQALNQSQKAITKKRNSLQKELDKAKQLEETMKRANLIVANLYQLQPGTDKAMVQDWDQDGMEVEIIFNTKDYSSPKDEADALFASARKMKRGSIIVQDLLSETEEALQIIDDALMDLNAALDDDNFDVIDEGRLILILERLERSSSRTGFVMKDQSSNKAVSSKPLRNQKVSSRGYQPSFRRFLSPNGCIVLVGKNRRDNEAICFQVARGNDIWFHARGCPGAHVLLQIRRGSPRPTDDCMQFAANLAAFYSDARTERKAPVTTASPKHIQKPRGAPPGAVKLREELNTITGFPADVAEELKIAREESGVIWDESGSRSLGGKAKNKKRTKAMLKQNIAKKRAEKREKRNRKASDGDENFW
jgi:hypothetical protein